MPWAAVGRSTARPIPPGRPCSPGRARRRGRPPLLRGPRRPTPAAATASTRAGDRARGAHRPRASRWRTTTTASARGRRAARPGAGPRERSLASATRSTPPSRRARDAPGRRPAARSWRRPGARGAGRRRRGPRPREALVEGWLASELRAELEASGARLRPEIPFMLALGGAVVRGKIDLLAERPRVPWSSTTRPTRCAAPTRPSSRSATRPSATSTRSPSTARGETGRRRSFAPPTASSRPPSGRRSRPTTRPRSPRRASASSG